MILSNSELFKDYEKYIGQDIEVEGWVKTLRDSNKIAFIELNDGSYFNNIQIVVDESKFEEFKQITKYPLYTALHIKGKLLSIDGTKQKFEINADEIELLATSDTDYPLQKKRHSLEFLRTIAHLRPRANTFLAVFRVRSVAAYAVHKFFQENGFVYANTPLITASDAEGAGEMFRVTTLDMEKPPMKDGKVDYKQDFFGNEAHLTVSGQLEAEIMAMAFKNVYTFGPTFRAENSNTARHAAEFWMIEPEMAFADLNKNMDVAEKMVKYIISYCLENAKPEMEFFNSFVDKNLFERLDNILNNDFERITYTKAIELLLNSGHKFDYKVEWGIDLQTEHERYITEHIFKKPVFVTDYPEKIKAFYMRQNDDGKTVAAMDLLVPGVGEIIGGSQREERLDILERKIKDNGLNMDNYWWYLELRKYGGVKHSGYGLGFERMIMYLTGMQNIRDVIAFPRTVGNAEF
ncbi:asparagine--tRNA ligase [Criibacterium bergeronii]|uniref:Asparagine--tRNA ligase n=1 Tax=Criibacterium bergeronii TaxID=1871336 RepID=A0A552VE34_9FIRM|nr:asparagine--tRNA ligase [Criibacterium bergeronii]TRW28670.1 asparagine--tRNA ligase [Criibacterium bergeronii]